MWGDHEGHAYNEYMLISGMLITRVVCRGKIKSHYEAIKFQSRDVGQRQRQTPRQIFVSQTGDNVRVSVKVYRDRDTRRQDRKESEMNDIYIYRETIGPLVSLEFASFVGKR